MSKLPEVGDIACDGCGSVLEKSECNYCGGKSNLLFMTYKEYSDLYIKLAPILHSDLGPITKYMGKRIVINGNTQR